MGAGGNVQKERERKKRGDKRNEGKNIYKGLEGGKKGGTRKKKNGYIESLGVGGRDKKMNVRRLREEVKRSKEM